MNRVEVGLVNRGVFRVVSVDSSLTGKLCAVSSGKDNFRKRNTLVAELLEVLT